MKCGILTFICAFFLLISCNQAPLNQGEEAKRPAEELRGQELPIGENPLGEESGVDEGQAPGGTGTHQEPAPGDVGTNQLPTPLTVEQFCQNQFDQCQSQDNVITGLCENDLKDCKSGFQCEAKFQVCKINQGADCKHSFDVCVLTELCQTLFLNGELEISLIECRENIEGRLQFCDDENEKCKALSSDFENIRLCNLSYQSCKTHF